MSNTYPFLKQDKTADNGKPSSNLTQKDYEQAELIANAICEAYSKTPQIRTPAEVIDNPTTITGLFLKYMLIGCATLISFTLSQALLGNKNDQ